MFFGLRMCLTPFRTKVLLFVITFVSAPFLCDGFWSFEYLKNKAKYYLDKETCDDYYTTPDFDKLKRDLDQHLYGQHLVKNTLLSLLRSHYHNEPRKPLVISMHGWSGGGKNYVTKMVVESLYKLKSESTFVHQFNGMLHFPLTSKASVEGYKIELQNWIRGNVTLCPRSTFIFDEIDKVPPELIESIKPFLDYYDTIDSIIYRKAIFVFISNIGGSMITRKYVEQWEKGIPREEMDYKTFESSLRHFLYQTESAFWKSELLEDHLVSAHLPFLPLEKEHIRLCIIAEMKIQGIPVRKDVVESVLNEMEFYDDRFSISGCKRVNDRVAMLHYRNEL